ncbi:autotransporter domain-containing protein [Anaerobiospirillum succiniciproducens]|uniref:autotransporter domain-containing protein n=1 Tax=Anaerobiospirillum succiniciproducens TaxID=13335 RepID=UPI003F8ACEE4
MKQTNNAIKFLMAQYRAIFKNANIAMVAAMVAAALAAGQAQAAADTTNPNNIGSKELADNNLDNNEEIKLAEKDKSFVLEVPNANAVNVNSGGKIILTDPANGHIFTKNDLVVNSGGYISLTGSSTQKNVVAGLVGAASDTAGKPQAVPSASLTIIKGGQLDVTSSFAMMKDVNINGTVNISGSTGKNTDDAQSGEYLKYAAVYAETGNLTVGSDAAVTLGEASHLYGQNIAINGGTIAFEGTTAAGKATALSGGALLRAGDSKNGGALTISNGKLNVANSKSGDIVATTLNMNGGEINVSGSLGIGGNYHDNAPAATINVTKGKVTVATGGNLKLNGEATFADGTVANSGIIEAVSGSKINVANTTGLYSASGKLKLTGATLTVTGAESLVLSTASIESDSGSKLVVENGSVTIDKDFVKKVGNVNAGTIVISGVEKGSQFATPGATQGSSSLKVGSGAHITAFNKLEGSKPRSILMLDPESGSKASLTLGDSAGSKGELKNIERVQIGYAKTAGKSEFYVHGTWDFNNAGLYVANGATATIHEGASITDVERLKIESGSKTIINGTATIKRLFGKNSGGTLDVNGTLNVTGDGNENDASTKSGEYINDVYLTDATLNINAGGTVALEKDAWDDVLNLTAGDDKVITNATTYDSTVNTKNEGAWVADKVTLNAGGTLSVDLSGYKVADNDTVEKIAQALAGKSYKGIVDLGKISITSLESVNGPVDIAKVPNVKTDATKKLEVNVGSGPLNRSYSIGSANVSGSSLTVASGSTLEFNNAKNGQFATNVSATGDADKSVGVTLDQGSALLLNGNGSLGNIQNSGKDTTVVLGGANGTQTVGDVNVAKFNMVGGNVTTGDVTTTTLNIAGGAINAAGKNITVSSVDVSASIFGDVEAGSLSLAGNATIAGNADVNLGTLKVAAKTLTVGQDGEDGSTATVYTQNLELAKNGKIFVDPEYKDKASIFATQNLTNGTGKEDTGVLSGSIFVGKNAAFGYGFDEAEFNSVMAKYLVDGKFVDPDENKGYANALVLNKPVLVAKDQGIVVDHTLTSTTVGTVPADTIKLGKNAVLIVTDNAVAGGKAAITFGQDVQASSAPYTATVEADESAVISLVGDFNAKSTNIKLFEAVTSGAAIGTLSITKDIKVEALGGLVVGTLSSGANGTLANLEVSGNAKTLAYAGVSRPVGDFFLGLASGDYVVDSTQAGHKFVSAVADTAGGFKVVDTAAHAATYAGAQQAAVASVTTMADAMFGRVGAVGVEAASISATGSQANGGVWLTPMYKSMDSDGFNAEGASYGSDVDLGGVAFGADTVNGNMRFGAVFNIGSGDSEGKGQGNGLKDEFDYYGFGIYSAMGFGNLALVGDASMTVISHDVEGLGLRGKADTTAVTMGITGQYTIATPAVDVTPHLGARFIRLNTDSYDLVGADGAIATTDFDVQNVFSVPLGVTLSKGFVTGGWTLAPSADLTVTFNAGDTEAKSTTTFSGIAHGINMNTEVLDEVQYGVTLGLGAQYGAFGTSFGINYTGSSNTDSLGVNAQARYMF